jgi:hypothetical protein
MVQSIGMGLGGSIITGLGFNVLHSYHYITLRGFMLGTRLTMIIGNGLFWLIFNMYLHFFIVEAADNSEVHGSKVEVPEHVVSQIPRIDHGAQEHVDEPQHETADHLADGREVHLSNAP